LNAFQLGLEVRADIAANLSESLHVSNIDAALRSSAPNVVRRAIQPFECAPFDGPLGAGTGPSTIQFPLRAVRQIKS
jgi:hypothetical protein